MDGPLEKELGPRLHLGTVISAVAVLLVQANHCQVQRREYTLKDSKLRTLFSAAREFRKASFKQISKSLSASQKQDYTVPARLKQQHINRKIDYNTNDFELANAIRELSKHFTEK